MENEVKPGLEKALAKTENDANGSLKAAQSVLAALRKIRSAARVGNLKDLRIAIDAADKAELALRQHMANGRAGWDFNEEGYLSDGSFIKEVLEVASEKGLRVFESDDRLFCYPVLIRVLPGERSALIDKTREKRLRPTVLVDYLKELQKRPPRFRPEAFLESLYSAYETAVCKRSRNRELLASDPVIALLDLYELLTLLPGQSREYSKQEFVRDVYLLHRSGVHTTRKGARVSFPASTGTKIPSRTLSLINERGELKRYYGICFSPPSAEAKDVRLETDAKEPRLETGEATTP
ncbi:MAG: hypothetical protein HY673_12130 [Chloroflexi bacterium]|nr:hypothetical protein [Chloroflexota bacterium]